MFWEKRKEKLLDGSTNWGAFLDLAVYFFRFYISYDYPSGRVSESHITIACYTYLIYKVLL